APYTAIIGNPNLALLVSAGVAMRVYARQRGVSRADLAEMVDTSLMSAGVMILIIAASGGFGVALQATGIGPVIERAFVGHGGGAASGTGSGLIFLFLGSWMNDSGFWLFSKMGGVTELETVKSWTPVVAAVGVTSMVMT